MQRPLRLVLPLFITYFIVSALTYIFWKSLDKFNIDVHVIRMANMLLLLISILSFFIQYRSMQNPNPHAFVRAVMLGLMVKMIACVAAVFVYHWGSGDNFNKKGIMVSLCLYLVYLAVEGYILMKLNRKKNA